MIQSTLAAANIANTLPNFTEGDSIEIKEIDREAGIAKVRHNGGSLEVINIGSTDELTVDESETVPPQYSREIEERMALCDDALIDVYASGISPWWGWRWKLMSWHEARPSVRGSCSDLIIDSGVKQFGTPDDVLDAATKVGADYVVASDRTGMETEIPHQYQDVDSLDITLDFLSQYESSDCPAKLILPVQPPYDTALQTIENLGLLDSIQHIALGGLKTMKSPDDRIAAIKQARSAVGYRVDLHALGLGMNLKTIKTIRSNPDLIDSLDVSTPENAPSKGMLPDAIGKQHKHRFPSGVSSTVVRAAAAAFIATQFAYMISPQCSTSEVEKYHQETLNIGDCTRK